MKKSDVALIVGALLVIILSIFALSNNKEKIERPVVLSDNFAEIKNIKYTDYKQMLDENKTFVIIIVRDGCTYCEQFMPVVKEVVEEKKTPIYSIDIATLEQDEIEEFQKSNSYLKNKEWGTPTTLVLRGSDVIDSLSGYTEKKKFIEFLDKNVKLPDEKKD